MPHHDTIALSGVVRDIFAHRFTFIADNKTYLGDLGPKGAEAFKLSEGLKVSLKGEHRPSEIKVLEIAAQGGEPVSILHKKPHHAPAPHHIEADASRALAAAKSAGWKPQGQPQRKPKHFEVLARKDDGQWAELHVDFDGVIYKTKSPDPAKWGVKLA